MSLLRVVLRIAGKAEVPKPPSNVLSVTTPEPKLTDEEVLYTLEPDRPYDWAVDGL